MAVPSQSELESILKFKSRLGDVQFGNVEDVEMLLLRFLRARDHNLDKAEEMLRKHVEWKRIHEIDKLDGWKPPQILTEKYPYEICGFDREGCPILVVPIGLWDVRRICESGLKSEYVRYVDQLFIAVLRAMSQSARQRVSQFICIFIPDGLSAFRQMSSVQAVDTVLETVRRFEANHPETLKAAFVVDSPKVFQIIFSVVKPLLNSRTLGKVTISSNWKEWKPELLELVERDQLPLRLGGTAHSHIPILNRGQGSSDSPPIGDNDDDENKFIALTVGPGRRISVQYDVDNCPTQFNWAFKTDRHDIGFSVLLEGSQVVVPYSRTNSHEEVQCGALRVQKPGKYVIVFDNGFSRWRSKVVRYRVSLELLIDEESVEEGISDTNALQMETMSL